VCSGFRSWPPSDDVVDDVDGHAQQVLFLAMAAASYLGGMQGRKYVRLVHIMGHAAWLLLRS